MTQIETLQAQLAQAQAENERLKIGITRYLEADIKLDKMQLNDAPISEICDFIMGEHGDAMESLKQALTPLPDGIGKAMADVVRAAVKADFQDCDCEEIRCEHYRASKQTLTEAVQAYQKLIEEA